MILKNTDVITVVSGLPRSGTSMMMRMLESGGMPVMTDGFRRADHDNPNGYYEYEAVKRMNKDSSWLLDAYGKALKVIYILLYTLPPQHTYKIIFMQRDLTEVIASQKTMLTRRLENQLLEDEQLKDLFNQQLQKLYQWMSSQPNLSSLLLDHREVLRDPQEATRKINSFLGLSLDTQSMVRTVDPGLHRNRSPRQDGPVALA